MGDQLSLFHGGEVRSTYRAGLVRPRIDPGDHALAARLPRFVRFGTSSWSFPGWRDVWQGQPSETELAQSGLEAYVQQPLLRAVGLDRSYYAPVSGSDLESYKAQIAAGCEQAPSLPRFRMLSKVWDELTAAVFPRHPRYGVRASTKNPHFLDPRRFVSEVLEPYERVFADDAGPFIFELTPMPQGALDERELVRRVDDFLSHLPSKHRYAFELRNAELFGPRWLAMLRANRAAHVFTFWTAMPPLGVQLRARALVAPFTVVRLILPPYTRYAARKADLAPFNAIVEPMHEMREDVVDILRAAAEHGCDEAFVLVGNKTEGCAPRTVRVLAEKTARAFESL